MLLRSPQSERRGVVLLMVLVVLVLLTLAAYQYSDLMQAEYQAADNVHKFAQARAVADSGVHYAAALLANPDNLSGLLNDNPFDNPESFRDVVVPGDPKTGGGGRFTLLAPPDPDGGSGEVRFGVTDEGGKINLNSLMKRDPTGQLLHDTLMKLPNMTAEIAGAIVDWIDADSTPFPPSGAERDYYAGLDPSYRIKNGPLDTLDELLLVRGVTPELLYGGDRNRNGILDPDEQGAEDRGWSAYLTIHSREQNTDPSGIPLIDLNNTELEFLYQDLSLAVGEDLAKFIVLYKQYGPSNTSGQRQTIGSAIFAMFGGRKGRSSSSPQPTIGELGDFEPDFARPGFRTIRSLCDLIDTQVTIPGGRGKPGTMYYSPLNDRTKLREMLPALFETATVFGETEMPARVNVNTAPREVLAALPDLTPAEVEAILTLRPRYLSGEAPDPIFRTPAWLISEADIKPRSLAKMEKMLTTKSQVYRLQVVGQLDEGPSARIEAVIDVNGGRPRILSWRDLSELGRSVALQGQAP